MDSLWPSSGAYGPLNGSQPTNPGQYAGGSAGRRTMGLGAAHPVRDWPHLRQSLKSLTLASWPSCRSPLRAPYTKPPGTCCLRRHVSPDHSSRPPWLSPPGSTSAALPGAPRAASMRHSPSIWARNRTVKDPRDCPDMAVGWPLGGSVPSMLRVPRLDHPSTRAVRLGPASQVDLSDTYHLGTPNVGQWYRAWVWLSGYIAMGSHWYVPA